MDCTGKRIAFTGISSKYERPNIHRAIRDSGGILVNTVNAKTDLLVVGETPGSGTGKRDAADKHDVPVISSVDFMEMVFNSSIAWSFGVRQTKTPTKKLKSKTLPKEVKQAFTVLAKNDAMNGFVGF